MKKLLSIVLFFLCCTGLLACSQPVEESDNIYQIYYVSNDLTKVEAHPHEMGAEDSEAILHELMECLATIPAKLTYKAPLEMGFTVKEVNMHEGRVLLDLSAEYVTLEPITEVLVRAAIVRTLTQMEDVQYVGFLVEGQQLFDSAGELVSWMGAEQFIQNDGNEINTYELARVKLYFANETGDKLIATTREKHYSTNMSLERFVVDELIAGPDAQSEGLYQAVNPETKVVNVMTRDGICYVNLDSAFLTVAGNVSVEVAAYSIVNSLAELNHISKVQILVNGEVPTSFSNAVFERDLDYVTTLAQ